MDENAPTTRMISEEPAAPPDVGEPVLVPPIPEHDESAVVVEYRAKWLAVPVIGSRAAAAVSGPDDTPVIVVEHSTAEGSWRFVIGDDDQARALRQSLWVAMVEWKRLTEELA